MSALVLVHVLAVGVWLGCLATEIVFEKAAAGDESVTTRKAAATRGSRGSGLAANLEKTLFEFYRDKFKDAHFDLIMASDDFAYNFILDNQDRLLPGVPVVFCGVNDFRPERLAGRRNVTGLVENVDFITVPPGRGDAEDLQGDVVASGHEAPGRDGQDLR